MDETFIRIWENLVDRVTGPMSFRLVLQPLVAAILAIRAGIEDARSGRPAYFWALLTTHGADRRRLLREGWTGIAKVFGVAILLDGVYQIVTQHWIFPGEAVLVAFVLAVCGTSRSAAPSPGGCGDHSGARPWPGDESFGAAVHLTARVPWLWPRPPSESIDS